MFDQNGEEMVFLINTVISWVSTVFPGGQPLRRPIETGGLSTSGFAVESGQVGTSRERGSVSAPYPGPDSSQGAPQVRMVCRPRALPETSRQLAACGPQTPNSGPGPRPVSPSPDPMEGGLGPLSAACVYGSLLWKITSPARLPQPPSRCESLECARCPLPALSVWLP